MKPQVIQQKIFEIRDQKVMLDFDLAELYGVETRTLNQAVKRNKIRFPGDFMFRLKPAEWKTISSQIVMSSKIKSRKYSKQTANGSRKYRGKTYLPYAFSEHGASMAANVLQSKKAIRLSVIIVRAFISLKKLALHHKDLATQLKDLRKELYDRLGEHDTQLAAIYDAIENLLDEKKEVKKWDERQRIGFRRKNDT